MVYISKVYTRFGDRGETMLADGSTVGKDSPRVLSYGEVDELNACVGLLRLELGRDPQRERDLHFASRADEELAEIQQQLFNLGAELASPQSTEANYEGLCVHPHRIEALEGQIDQHNEALPPLKSFTLPGGGPTASAAHLARTVCRRAERRAVELSRETPIREEALIYLNRLSDYFFVLSRAAAKSFHYDEVLWKQEA